MKHSSAQTGQALLELIFAIAMVIFLITGFVSAMRVGLKNQAFSRNKSESIRIAEEGIEIIYSCREDRGFGRIDECDTPSSGVEVLRDGYPDFTRTITLSDAPNFAGNTDIRLVTSTVTWVESTRVAQTSLSTIITNWK